MAIIIKKRITLEFLGDEYKDGYLVFQSIPVRDYDRLLSESAALAEDNTASLAFIRKQVSDRFIEGKIPQDGELVDVAKDDLLDLPGTVFLEAMNQLTGNLSPKAETP